MDLLSSCSALPQILQYVNHADIPKCMSANKRIFNVVKDNWKRIPKHPVKITIRYMEKESAFNIGIRLWENGDGQIVLLSNNSVRILPGHHPLFISYMRQNCMAVENVDGISIVVQNFGEGLELVLDCLLYNTELKDIKMVYLGNRFNHAMFQDIIAYFREYNFNRPPTVSTYCPSGHVDPTCFQLADALRSLCRIQINSSSSLCSSVLLDRSLPSVIQKLAKENKIMEIVVVRQYMRKADLVMAMESWKSGDISIPGLSVFWEKNTEERRFPVAKPTYLDNKTFLRVSNVSWDKRDWIGICDHFHAKPTLNGDKGKEIIVISRVRDRKQLRVSYNCTGEFVINLRELEHDVVNVNFVE